MATRGASFAVVARDRIASVLRSCAMASSRVLAAIATRCANARRPTASVYATSGSEKIFRIGAFQMICQPGTLRYQRGVRSRRQAKHLLRSLRQYRFRRWSFFQHHVNIGAANSKSAHPSPSNRASPRPRRRLAGNHKRSIRQIQLRIRLAVVQRSRNLFAIKRQGRLHQAGHACRNIQMSNISLHRTQQTRRCPRLARSKRLRQRTHFNGIAQRRAGSVAFDIVDRCRIDTRHRIRHGRSHPPGLCGWARHSQTCPSHRC